MELRCLAVISEADRDWRVRRQALEARLTALAPSHPGGAFRCIRVAVPGTPPAYYYVLRARQILQCFACAT